MLPKTRPGEEGRKPSALYGWRHDRSTENAAYPGEFPEAFRITGSVLNGNFQLDKGHNETIAEQETPIWWTVRSLANHHAYTF